MKNLIFHIDDLTSGGAQRQMVNLAILFKRNGYKVSVITYYERNYYESTLLVEGIETICLPEKSPVKRIIKVRKEILKRKPNTVFSYILIPNFIASLSTFPVKKFKLIVGERSADPALLSSVKSRFLRLFHARADLIVTNSNANAELLNQIVPFYSGKIRVVYNMMNLEYWKPREGFQFKSKRRLRIGVAASHRYLKNAKGMLEALNKLENEEKSRLEVFWYGKKLTPPHLDGSVSEVVDLIAKYGLGQTVHLIDETKDIRNEMREMDAIGLFSFFEGLPNAVCEGMALGKPIIASAVSDVPLLVEDNYSGFLFNPKRIDELVLALRNLLSLSSEEMLAFGVRNRDKAEALFNEEAIYQRFENFIKE